MNGLSGMAALSVAAGLVLALGVVFITRSASGSTAAAVVVHLSMTVAFVLK
jgi:hypothetical protein